MDYAKYTKAVSGVNAARLAMWAAVLAMVIVAGLAAWGTGPS